MEEYYLFLKNQYLKLNLQFLIGFLLGMKLIVHLDTLLENQVPKFLTKFDEIINFEIK